MIHRCRRGWLLITAECTTNQSQGQGLVTGDCFFRLLANWWRRIIHKIHVNNTMCRYFFLFLNPLSLSKTLQSSLLFCCRHHNYLKVTIIIISRAYHWLYGPFPVAFSHEELKCCETAALSRIKLVLSKAHFILTTASGCIDAAMKARLGIFFPLSCRSKIFHHGKH